MGRCTSIQTPSFNQNVPSDGFDASGNLLKFERQQIPYTFSYDDNFQLNSEKGHVEHTFAFDSVSNRTTCDLEKYSHNALNQQLQKGNEKLEYDLNGNLIKKGDTEYSYDSFDRLTAVTCNGVTTTYTYDSFNRRMTKQCQDEEELFLYQGQDEIGKWIDGKCQELCLLGKNPLSHIVAIELAGVPYVPIHDMSGHVSLLLNLQGEVVEQYRYSAFGETETLSPTGQILPRSAVGNPWQYAGKRLDEESGLIAFGMRYYDPSLGRWTSPDPLGFEDGPNLYAYVHNNPFRYFDRLGLFSDEFDSISWNFNDFPIAGASNMEATHHSFAGMLHGGFDFFNNTAIELGSIFNTVAIKWTGLEETVYPGTSYGKLTTKYLDQFDNWLAGALHVDRDNALYQNCRLSTSTSLEVASLAVGGYGLVKGGIHLAKGAIGLNRFTRFSQQAEIAGSLASGEVQLARQSLLSTFESRVGQLNVPKGGVARSNGFLGRSGWELKNTSYQPVRNSPAIINGRSYSSHAIDQMQNRGLMPSTIEDTIKNGFMISGKKPQTKAYYNQTNNISVIIDAESGRVITTGFGKIRQ
jgi:RHS repeat-associated protein